MAKKIHIVDVNTDRDYALCGPMPSIGFEHITLGAYREVMNKSNASTAVFFKSMCKWCAKRANKEGK